ncbi:TIGR02594 family protein [uncultured Massilia sp.]|uniref:NlpC/P60 family protein n=1 Tax=uncultured Massilia sp. TaxID=169973 RepID=UPI0025FA5614|nr:TIGR02594 family protein [uncultured Massilia sp.]
MDIQVRHIQEALRAAGCDPGPVDGIWGRRTIAAVTAFQRREGLAADGIVGPRTWAALQRVLPADGAVRTPLPWLAEARRLLYTREILGARDNPDILRWADELDIAYAGDEVPWCGLFVGHCIGATLPAEVLPAGLLLARSWTAFGTAVTPREGAVMVFWRGARASALGHVGFYAGESGEAYCIIGGNQGDSVCYIWMPKARLLGARWPGTAALLQEQAGPIQMAAGNVEETKMS